MRTDKGWRRFYAVGWLVSGVVAVGATYQWQMHVREVEKRLAESERTQEELAGRLAAEERLRIARELHDSLTHSISVVTLQAGVATHLARKRGDPVPPALAAIQEAAGEAMRELRETLTTLRGDDASPGSRLADIPRLVSRTNAAGLPTRVAVRGAERVVPDAVSAAAYRIVQEALTNVARHAGPAQAVVSLEYAKDVLVVVIEDDGPGVDAEAVDEPAVSTAEGPAGVPARGAPAAASTGLGLVGMRERTTALGGRLTAGPRERGGFGVRAELPLVGVPA